jgi:hypothetical protein
MFDNLREISEGPSEFEELDEAAFEPVYPEVPEKRFLGMTVGQRFLISLLLLGTVVVMGVMCLMVTERIWLY